MNNTPSLILRTLIAGLAIIGLVGVFPVSYAEILAGGSCPHLGPIPACHIVSVAYSIVFVSTAHPRLWNSKAFILSWLIILSLALIGTSLEVLGMEACPKTEGGIPKCYFSLALAIFLFVPFFVNLLKSRQ